MSAKPADVGTDLYKKSRQEFERRDPMPFSPHGAGCWLVAAAFLMACGVLSFGDPINFGGPIDASSGDIQTPAEMEWATENPSNPCAKNSPAQTCWDFSDVYNTAELVTGNWHLGSCWSTTINTLRTEAFPTKTMVTDSICEANLPLLEVKNPNVDHILVKAHQTINVVGVDNSATAFADLPTSSVLLFKTAAQSGVNIFQFSIKSGDTFRIRLALLARASSRLPDGAWQIQRIEVIPYCNGQICSL